LVFDFLGLVALSGGAAFFLAPESKRLYHQKKFESNSGFDTPAKPAGCSTTD
jgi:hypothetical protein